MSDNKGNNQMSKASQALLEIYNSIKELMNMFDGVNVIQKENNKIIKEINYKINNSSSSGGTITYEQMLYYISKRPMYKLSPRQVYYMVERGDDLKYIMAVSGYSEDEIKKKYKMHKDSNVYK